MIVTRNSGHTSDGNAVTREDHRGPEYEWQEDANRTLYAAMISERSRQWKKVVTNYTKLLEMLSEASPTEDKERPAWLTLLLYECHYHLGVALQRLDQPKKAIEEYTKAIKSVFISRNGCMVPRCRLASCLMTPVYARRAFAFAYSGDTKNSALDAEKAVVFDSANPDVYCIRALVLNTCNKTTQAVEDVRKALKLNGKHVCALILQGAMKKKDCKDTNDICSGSSNQTTPEEHLKAVKLNPDSGHYLTVDSFRHRQILEFYDRFLYSLSVPHTISHVMNKDNSLSQTKELETNKNEGIQLLPKSESLHSFRHIVSSRDSKSSRISSAAAAFRASISSDRNHCVSSSKRKSFSESFHCNQLISNSSLQRRTAYGQAATKGNAHSRKQWKFISLEKPKTMTDCLNKIPFDKNCSETKQNTIKTPNGIQIFQEVNLNEIPRLYYRPWMGDRLPVAEIERKQRIFPPFKV